MEFANGFKDLEVYKCSRLLSKEIFELSKNFPKEEMYSLTDQVRRSSRSVGAQIAEAWGKRLYVRHFICKLSDSVAEQLETQHWIETAYDCAYLTEDQSNALAAKNALIGKMLQSMMNKASSFCFKSSNNS